MPLTGMSWDAAISFHDFDHTGRTLLFLFPFHSERRQLNFLFLQIKENYERNKSSNFYFIKGLVVACRMTLKEDLQELENKTATTTQLSFKQNRIRRCLFISPWTVQLQCDCHDGIRFATNIEIGDQVSYTIPLQLISEYFREKLHLNYNTAIKLIEMDPCNSLYNNATIRGYLKLVKAIEEGQAHDHYQVMHVIFKNKYI